MSKTLDHQAQHAQARCICSIWSAGTHTAHRRRRFVAMHGASAWGADMFPLDRIRLQHALRSHAWPAASPSLQHPSLAARRCDRRSSEAHAPQSEQLRRRGSPGDLVGCSHNTLWSDGWRHAHRCCMWTGSQYALKSFRAARLTQVCRCALNVLSRAHQVTARRQLHPSGAAMRQAADAAMTHLRLHRGQSGLPPAAIVVEARAAAEDVSRCSL